MEVLKEEQKTWKVPVADDGRYMIGECWGRTGDKDIPIFKAKMKLDSYGRGRSAAYFMLDDLESNQYYQCGLESFFEMVSSDMNKGSGIFEGIFTLKKQGSRISVIPYKGKL